MGSSFKPGSAKQHSLARTCSEADSCRFAAAPGEARWAICTLDSTMDSIGGGKSLEASKPEHQDEVASFKAKLKAQVSWSSSSPTEEPSQAKAPVSSPQPVEEAEVTLQPLP